jgi:hypothetical protein
MEFELEGNTAFESISCVSTLSVAPKTCGLLILLENLKNGRKWEKESSCLLNPGGGES